MPTELNAVYEELIRLKEAGLDRVFVDDATWTLLKPTTTPIASTCEKPQRTMRENTIDTLTSATPNIYGKPLPQEPPVINLSEGDAAVRIKQLHKQVMACSTCNEHLSKHGKIVFGTGNVEADIFFCGEAPGADEERAGEPFVGPAGKLLNKIIQAMGLSRDEVYIGNILKWRPEHDKPFGNRPPTIEEMRFCLPYLKAQIEIVKPKVIVALGNTAVTGLLGPDPNRRLGQVRGKWHDLNGTSLMITFHPSYLLHKNTISTKRNVWEDMLQVMEKINIPVSDKQRSFFLPKT